MEKAKVISLDERRELNEERKNELAMARAAYWECRREDAWRALEVAEREREKALREAGMLPLERGVSEANEQEQSERLVREADRIGTIAAQYELDFGRDVRGSGIPDSTA